jgi:hypothetical protein
MTTQSTSRCARTSFAYADTFDASFHVAAITELARIARSEVLIHPISARDGRNLDDFTDAVDRGLSAAGLHSPDFPRRRGRRALMAVFVFAHPRSDCGVS